MMDDKEVKYIDANELIYIESDANAYAEEWNADYEKGFTDCLNKVMALPTIEAEPDNGWISVKDRLPELFKNVLTIDSEGKIFINWLEDITETNSYFAYGSGSVTHWQHLPEPPKGV